MHLKNIFLTILLFFLIISCSKEEVKISIIQEDDLNLQVIEAYEEGLESLKEGDVLYAAKKCKVKKIFKTGGAHSIAAFAYGTKNFEKVDKIVGPGNTFVACAKKEVFGDVGIDMVAGPSEVSIVADKTADPDLVAADLIAQAEHDIYAQ